MPPDSFLPLIKVYPKRRQFSISLEREELVRLDLLAARYEVSRSEMAAELVRRGGDELQELIDELDAKVLDDTLDTQLDAKADLGAQPPDAKAPAPLTREQLTQIAAVQNGIPLTAVATSAPEIIDPLV